MKRSPLPKEADQLLAFGEATAAVLAEKRDELGMNTEVETLLRGSIAAATSSINSYLGVLANAKKSRVALSHLAAARSRCDRNIRQPAANHAIDHGALPLRQRSRAERTRNATGLVNDPLPLFARISPQEGE